MAITILEATKLNTFKNFKLISGFDGLNNLIEKVGILDWEFFSNMKGQFIRGEFVLSSLLFAKDNSEYILEAVKNLIEDRACGLAVKNIYYNELPSEVIEYANSKSFPIFIFDTSAYFEDIITEVMEKIKTADNYDLLEGKIDVLIRQNLNKTSVKEVALEINSSFKEQFFVLYCRKKTHSESTNIILLIEKLRRNKRFDLHSSVLKYRNGILLIYTGEKIVNKQSILTSLLDNANIYKDEYYIGISNIHYDLGELDNAINESLYSEKAGEISSNSLSDFNDIGIYMILLPYIDEIWIKKFYDRVMLPIKNYDEKYNTQLFETAVKYVENEGRIIETAESLFLHKNTVRYRIGKIKELLNMENYEGSFYEQLSISIKLYKIINN